MAELRKIDQSKDVEAFLKAEAAIAPTHVPGERGRLILAMDATMSRQPTWDRALAIQSEMFAEAGKASGLDVQLVYFRGFNECQASRWTSDANALARLMSKVDCRGGNTQIARILKHIKSEATRGKVHAAVYIGDAVEENIDQLCQLAGEVGLLGSPLFMFLEGNDAGAERAYREIARLSRGAFHRLDASAPSVLGQLLRAVAAYATGGIDALRRLEAAGNASSTLLLSQLKT